MIIVMMKCTVYHGGMDDTQRKKSLRVLNRSQKSLHVIVATSAFGMGVNLKNIKVGAISGIPKSVLFICMEVGRFRGMCRRSDVTAGMRKKGWR